MKKPIKTLALMNLPRESMEDFLKKNPAFVSGFVDGEGCFTFYFTKRGNIGLQITPSFSVSQSTRSKEIILGLQEFFNCGGIRKSTRDGTLKFESRAIKDINQKIIPFFKRYPLYTTKWYDFEIFCYVCSMIQRGLHLNKDGMLEIVELVFQMNNVGQNRKYSKEEFLKILHKGKV
jgi:hypothetical protein